MSLGDVSSTNKNISPPSINPAPVKKGLSDKEKNADLIEKTAVQSPSSPSSQVVSGTRALPHPNEAQKADNIGGQIKPTFEEAVLHTATDTVDIIAYSSLAVLRGNRIIATLGDHQIIYQKTSKGKPSIEIDEKVHEFATKREEALGKGGFKIAFLESDSTAKTARLVLAKSKKTLANLSEIEKNAFLNELNIQLALSGHSEFLHLGHAFVYNGKHGEKVGLMMEFCDHGNVYDQTLEGDFDLRTRNFPVVFMDTLNGLAVLEQEGIQHRDIKGHNIFMTTDPDNPSQLRGKIADFGFAIRIGTHSVENSKMSGTPEYMSPSYIKGKTWIEHGKVLLAQSEQLKKQATNSKNPELGALLLKNAAKMEQRGSRLIAMGTDLYINTKNDIWAAGIVLNEMHGQYPACIPPFVLDPQDPKNRIIDPNYNLQAWIPFLEENATNELNEHIKANKENIGMLKEEQKYMDPNSSDFADRKEQIETLSKDIIEIEEAIAQGNAAYHILIKETSAVGFYQTWMTLLTQEALDKAKAMQILGESDPEKVDMNDEAVKQKLAADTSTDDRKTVEFNYRMLRVDVRSQASAKDLAAEFKAMKDDIDAHNKGKQTGLRSLFWLPG